jgi:perosamine synthetase
MNGNKNKKESNMINLKDNPFGKFNGDEQKYVTEALNSDSKDKRKGKWVQTFEEKFCKVFKVKYAIACNSATSGLHAALVACGVKEGDEVISPALGVVMDSYVTIFTGAIPVFADVNPLTQNIDPKDIERKITSKTKAIIAISLQGLSADLDSIMKIAKKHNLYVIEDAAQCLMGKYKGRYVGTNGHIGVYSFESKKHMTTGGEGGMIVTNDKILAERARKFAGIGYKHLTAEQGRTSLAIDIVQNPNYTRFDSLGLNYRMTEVAGAIGLAQLERIKSIIKRRQTIANYFYKATASCSWIQTPFIPKDYEHVYYTYPIYYYGRKLTWKEFYNEYKKMGGDGFYGACKVIYLEPIYTNSLSEYCPKYPCTFAEAIQPTIMQFKTNYRNLNVAKEKAQILSNLIDKIGRNE